MIAPLRFSPGFPLRKLSKTQTNVSSSSIAVSERTRGKTNVSTISDEKLLVVIRKRAAMQERLVPVTVNLQAAHLGKRIEEYSAESEKAIGHGKR